MSRRKVTAAQVRAGQARGERCKCATCCQADKARREEWLRDVQALQAMFRNLGAHKAMQ